MPRSAPSSAVARAANPTDGADSTRKPDPRSARTRLKVLDTAEKLFARQGYDGTSLREITAQAGVNIGAVNYYFGNKRNLFEAVFRRRLEPINARRVALLEACANDAGQGRPSLDGVVRAFLMPVIENFDRPKGKTVLEFINRSHNENDKLFESVIVRFHDDVWRVGGPLLERALPDLPKDVVYWRAYFMVGNLYHICRRRRWLKTRSGGSCDSADLHTAIEQLIAYVKGGMTAPVAASPG